MTGNLKDQTSKEYARRDGLFEGEWVLKESFCFSLAARYAHVEVVLPKAPATSIN